MRLSPDELRYNRKRWSRPDGSEYVVAEAIIQGTDAVEFHDRIIEEQKTKLDDIADLRLLKAAFRGVERPMVLVWEGYTHQDPIVRLRDLPLSDGLTYVSRNAWTTHLLRRMIRERNFSLTEGRLQVKDTNSLQDTATAVVLDRLYQEDRLALYGVDQKTRTEDVYANLDPQRDIIGVGRLGFPSRYARTHGYPIVFNGGYFLFEEEDFASDFSLLGDSYSLVMKRGQIITPPVYHRSALFLGPQGNAALHQVGLPDLIVRCLGKEWDIRQFSYNQPGSHAVFNRYFGVRENGMTHGRTPDSPGSIDIIIVAQAVVGFNAGGGTPIPQNAFVLSVPAAEVDLAGKDTKVAYSLNWEHSYHTAIQCGPGLLRDGIRVLQPDSLKREEFFRKRMNGNEVQDYGVVPTDYAEDIDRTRAARTAVGVDAAGNLRVLAVEAVNQGMEETSEHESSGCTLQELAELLQYHGYRYALNLDGGGSTNIQYQYGHLLRGADRRGLPGVFYERMVPSVGVIKLTK